MPPDSGHRWPDVSSEGAHRERPPRRSASVSSTTEKTHRKGSEATTATDHDRRPGPRGVGRRRSRGNLAACPSARDRGHAPPRPGRSRVLRALPSDADSARPYAGAQAVRAQELARRDDARRAPRFVMQRPYHDLQPSPCYRCCIGPRLAQREFSYHGRAHVPPRKPDVDAGDTSRGHDLSFMA